MSVNYIDKSTGDLIRVAGGGNDILYADSPIGSIIPYGGTTAPDGFLLCQGQAVSRTTYSELFAVIGTSFGSGDGSTTFNVPDLRGEFLRGAGTNIHSGQGNGGIVGQHQDATTVPYFGSFLYGDNVVVEPGVARDMTRQYVSNYDKVIEASSTYYGIIGSQKVESGTLTTAGTVRPTNTSVNYIIKAKQVDAPADFMDAIDEAIETELEIKNITLTKVSVASNSGIMAKKSGSVVSVNFSALLTLDQATPGGTILASGFPKPVFNIVRFGLYDAQATDIATGLVQINSDGNLVADGQGLKQNIVYWGTFTYLTNE